MANKISGWISAFGVALFGFYTFVLDGSQDEVAQFTHWKQYSDTKFVDLVDPNDGLTERGYQYFFPTKEKGAYQRWKMRSIQEKKEELLRAPLLLRSLYEVVRRYEVNEVSYQFGVRKSEAGRLQLSDNACAQLGKKREDYCVFLFHPLATDAQVAEAVRMMRQRWGFEYVEPDARTDT